MAPPLSLVGRTKAAIVSRDESFMHVSHSKNDSICAIDCNGILIRGRNRAVRDGGNNTFINIVTSFLTHTIGYHFLERVCKSK